MGHAGHSDEDHELKMTFEANWIDIKKRSKLYCY